jgi:predicted RNA-binding protein YlqC (UPF0109 family)
MEEFLRYVIGKLVEYPDDVLITRKEKGKTVKFLVSMRKSDYGKIIGRGGHTIHALRTVLKAAARKKGLRTSLIILE